MRKRRLPWQLLSSQAVASLLVLLLARGLLREPRVPFAMEALLAFTLGGTACFWVSRRVSRPLEAMTTAVSRFAEDQWPGRLSFDGCGEIGDLAQAINRTAERLHKQIGAIRHSHNEQEAMLASMEEGVLAIDMDGRIINLNQTCATLLGAEPDAVRGRIVHEVIRKTDLLSLVERALSGQSPAECDLCTRDAGERWLHAHSTTLNDADHRTIGALIVLHDITHLRRLENVRRDFVANVSHELRTPITSIKGFVETLLDDRLEDRETAMRFLRIVLRQVNRLNAIIEDLLILSRIERGAEELTIELGEDSVREVLLAAIEMWEKQAVDKGIRLELDCASDLKARMNPHLLEQAIVNLIGNAVRYSESGTTVQVVAGQDNHEVVIQVRDEGCGIEAKHLPRLFERFYRVDKARSRELGGTGLGLAIVKHIALAHRGVVTVESTVGRGSTFSLRLPSTAAMSP